MRFTRTLTIDLPRRYIWDRMSDPARFGDRLADKGVEATQIKGEGFAPGSRWRIAGVYRRKRRQAEVEILALTPMKSVTFLVENRDFQARIRSDFSTVGDNDTELAAEIDLTLTSLRARLAAPALRLAARRGAARLKKRAKGLRKRFKTDLQAWRNERRALRESA